MSWWDDSHPSWINGFGRGISRKQGKSPSPTPEDLRQGQVRRRIEDIREASRLERTVLEEVWD